MWMGWLFRKLVAKVVKAKMGTPSGLAGQAGRYSIPIGKIKAIMGTPSLGDRRAGTVWPHVKLKQNGVDFIIFN